MSQPQQQPQQQGTAEGWRRPHFAVIPWMAQGHFIPMVDIARLLVDGGAADVTVVTTPGNAARIAGVIGRLSASGLRIRFATLRFPSLEAGLPEGCENLDSIPSRDMARNFFDAAKLLRPSLEVLLRGLDPPASCIVAGIGFPWLDPVAREMGIPRFVFQGFSSFSLLATHALYRCRSAVSPSELFVLPGMLHRVEVTAAQLPQCFDQASMFSDIYTELRNGELTADGFVVNSFAELEPGYAKGLERETGKKVWTIGPVSLSNRDRADAAERGNKAAVGEEGCLRWLEVQAPRSVLYVSFGSMGRLEPQQWVEMGAGLAAAGRPFVWVIRAGMPEVEQWLSEEEFEENTAERCLMIRGWAPQVMILSHPAVGGFLTHCGWNSTLEGVSAGLPMLTWPLAADQFLNEKLAVEVLGIAVSVGARGTAAGRGEVVGRAEVERAVERLMGGGEERRRKRATELGEMARRAMEEGGSSRLNLAMLVQHVLDHQRGGKQGERDSPVTVCSAQQ